MKAHDLSIIRKIAMTLALSPLALAIDSSRAAAELPKLPILVANSAGYALSISSAGAIDGGNPFFQPFGNGRSCASCHNPQGGWSIVPADLALRFALSKGTDPVFRLHDGATSPNAAVATLEQKRTAYAMLLSKGLIRIGMPAPANAEFTLYEVDDPYGFASASQLSLFRRPPPSTNLRFASGVMWDGRVTLADAKGPCIIDSRPAQCFASTDFDLQLQANFAVLDHAQAAQGLTAAQQRAIVDFEMSLSSAQLISHAAGPLNLAGARGGPYELARSKYYFGINDVEAGDYRSGVPFNPHAMTLYAAWQRFAAPPIAGRNSPWLPPAAVDQARAAIARGEQLFNSKAFNISSVAGFSDTLRRPLQRGTCSSCHSTPDAGSHSLPRFFNTGTADGALRTADLPLYTLKNTATGEIIETSDPGVAMISGKWADIGKVKVPTLRALAARPPYFHNGSAARLIDVVRFYERRFRIGLSPQEQDDLTAFLSSL